MSDGKGYGCGKGNEKDICVGRKGDIKLYGRAKEWVTRKEKTRVVQVGSMKGTLKSDGKGK